MHGVPFGPPMPNQIKVYKGGTLSSSLDVVSLPISICDRNIYREDEHGNEKNNLLKSSGVMKTPCSLIQILRNQEHDSASLIRSIVLPAAYLPKFSVVLLMTQSHIRIQDKIIFIAL